MLSRTRGGRRRDKPLPQGRSSVGGLISCLNFGALGYPFNRSSTTLLRWITLALASIIRGPWASSMPGSRRMRTAWTTSNGCDGQPASFVRPAGMMWAGGLVTGASCARSAAAGRQ